VDRASIRTSSPTLARRALAARHDAPAARRNRSDSCAARLDDAIPGSGCAGPSGRELSGRELSGRELSGATVSILTVLFIEVAAEAAGTATDDPGVTEWLHVYDDGAQRKFVQCRTDAPTLLPRVASGVIGPRVRRRRGT